MGAKFKVGDRVRSLDYVDVGEGIVIGLPKRNGGLYSVNYSAPEVEGENPLLEWEREMELIGDQTGITSADMPDFVETVTKFSAGPDMVDHPAHYTQYEGFEVIDIVEQLDFLMGGAVKYILRAPYKGNEKQDLEKAIWLLQRRIDNLSKKS